MISSATQPPTFRNREKSEIDLPKHAQPSLGSIILAGWRSLKLRPEKTSSGVGMVFNDDVVAADLRDLVFVVGHEV